MLDMEGCAETVVILAYASKNFSIEVMYTTIGSNLRQLVHIHHPHRVCILQLFHSNGIYAI